MSHEFRTQPTSIQHSQRILRNAARCRTCGDTIESKHRHDFVPCTCGAIFVDGGQDYLRRGGKPEDFEDLSTFAESAAEVAERLAKRLAGARGE